MRKDIVDKWLIKAEQAAGLEHLRGGIWHPYRRKWATERKDLPVKDVAAAGGWRSLQALQECYQAADKQTTLAVVLGGGELREAQGERGGGETCTVHVHSPGFRPCQEQP